MVGEGARHAPVSAGNGSGGALRPAWCRKPRTPLGVVIPYSAFRGSRPAALAWASWRTAIWTRAVRLAELTAATRYLAVVASEPVCVDRIGLGGGHMHDGDVEQARVAGVLGGSVCVNVTGGPQLP